MRFLNSPTNEYLINYHSKFILKESDLIKKTFYFFFIAFFFSILFCKISIFFTNDHRINVLAYSFGVPFAIFLLKEFKTIKVENIKSTRRWLALAIATPLLYASILYLLGTYFFPFTPSSLLKVDNIPYAIIMILLSITFEEIGWRGYLYKYCTAEGWLKMNISISIL